MDQVINYENNFEVENCSLEECWKYCFRRLADEPENQDEMIDEQKNVLFNLFYYHLIGYSTVTELYERSLAVTRAHLQDRDDQWVWRLEGWILSKITSDPMMYCEYGGQADETALMQIMSEYDYVDPRKYEQCECADMITWEDDFYFVRVLLSQNPYWENKVLYKNDSDLAITGKLRSGKIFLSRQAGFAYVDKYGGYAHIDLKNQTICEKKGEELLEVVGRAMIWAPGDGTFLIDRLNDDGSRSNVLQVRVLEEKAFRTVFFLFYLVMDNSFEENMKKYGLYGEASYIKNEAIRLMWKVILLYCFDMGVWQETQYTDAYFEDWQLVDIRGKTLSCKLIKEKSEIIRKLVETGLMTPKEENVNKFQATLAEMEKEFGEEADITVHLIRNCAGIWQDRRLIRHIHLISPIIRYTEW